MERATGDRLKKRIRLSQKLYQEGASLEKIAETIGKSPATAWLNALGFSNYPEYSAELARVKGTMHDRITENMERISLTKYEISQIEKSRRGIIVSGNFEIEEAPRKFKENIAETIEKAEIEEVKSGQYNAWFDYRISRMKLHYVLPAGSEVLALKAFIDVYGDVVLSRELKNKR
jgi:hypothetical protein